MSVKPDDFCRIDYVKGRQILTMVEASEEDEDALDLVFVTETKRGNQVKIKITPKGKERHDLLANAKHESFVSLVETMESQEGA